MKRRGWTLVSSLALTIAGALLLANDAQAAECGGLGQPACEATAATKHDASGCRDGEFHDVWSGACWTCPAGYQRSLSAITAANACFVPVGEGFNQTTRHDKATGILGTDCPAGQFWDAVDGHCYSCPEGYDRTAYHVHESRACSAVVPERHAEATRARDFPCPAGQFEDLLSPGDCYSCPPGATRTLQPIQSTNACRAEPCDEGLMAYDERYCKNGNCLVEYAKRKCGKKGECGAHNQRPCYVWERLASCNEGHFENFVINRCVRLQPGENAVFKSLEKFGDEMGNTQDTCKRWFLAGSALHDRIELTDAVASYVGLEGTSEFAFDKASACTAEVFAGASCAAVTIPRNATASAQLVQAINTAYNEPPCSAPLEQIAKPAVLVKNGPMNSCDPNNEEFWDIREGGQCWKCPGGMQRSWTPVTSQDACYEGAASQPLLRMLCAVGHGMGSSNLVDSFGCITELLTKGDIAEISKMAASSVKPWNSACTFAGELGFGFALDAAVAAGTGGASVPASSATRAQAFFTYLRETLKIINNVAKFAKFQTTVANIAACKAYIPTDLLVLAHAEGEPGAADPDSQLQGTYTIQQKSNSRYVEARQSSSRDYALVTRAAQNDHSQRWVLTPLGDDTYAIQQKSNNRYVAADESSGEGFALVTRTAHNDDSQRWIVKPLGNGTYTIQQKSNGRYLDADESGDRDFALVSSPAQNNDSQRWVIKPN